MNLLNKTWVGQAHPPSIKPHAPLRQSGNNSPLVRTAEEIQSWLVSQLAERLELSPEEIDIRKDFNEYGLNSIEAVNLSGGLEHFLGRRLEPTLIWDYPNIYTLVQYLAGGSASAGLEALTHPEIQPADAQQLLANLDQMPDETVDALLNSMLPVEESA